METPSSTTRSQTMAFSNNSNKSTKIPTKTEDSEKKLSRTSKQDRSPFIDLSNESPIVGIASGNLVITPISSVAKQRSCKKTPGSGEALLRDQVKNLLQQVEEEAEFTKPSLQSCCSVRHGFKAMFNSPASLVAPTPVNTPEVLSFSDFEEFESLSCVPDPLLEDQLILLLPQVISGIIDKNQQAETSSVSKNDQIISRTLFPEFSEKSDTSSDCSSVITYQETTEVDSKRQDKMTSIEEDDASIWSIQANASTQDEKDEDEVNQGGIDDEYYQSIQANASTQDEEDEEEVNQGGIDDEYYHVGRDDIPDLDELCEGVSNISVDGQKFMGKHIRFVYNSDDELLEKCEEEDDSADILHLKIRLPTPKGKHIRFQNEDGEED